MLKAAIQIFFFFEVVVDCFIEELSHSRGGERDGEAGMILLDHVVSTEILILLILWEHGYLLLYVEEPEQ